MVCKVFVEMAGPRVSVEELEVLWSALVSMVEVERPKLSYPCGGMSFPSSGQVDSEGWRTLKGRGCGSKLVSPSVDGLDSEALRR